MNKIELADGKTVTIEEIERAIYYKIGSSRGFGPIVDGKIEPLKHETSALVINLKTGESKQAVGNADKLKVFLEEQNVRIDLAPEH